MYDNYKNVKDLSTEVMQLHERFEKAQEKIKSFNERENLFKLPITEYDELIKLQKSFQPYHKLWDLAMEFDLDK